MFNCMCDAEEYRRLAKKRTEASRLFWKLFRRKLNKNKTLLCRLNANNVHYKIIPAYENIILYYSYVSLFYIVKINILTN